MIGGARLLAAALAAAAPSALVALLATAIPSAAWACSSFTGCREPPASGANPSYAQTSSLIETVSQHRQAAGDGPAVAMIYKGTSKVTATLPCLLFKSIIYVESSWTHFCRDTNLTIIPTSCGFGYSQITWGMKASHTFATAYDRSLVAANPLYNLSTGLSFLADNWNLKPAFAGRDPEVIEHWYFAAWRYNNYVWDNNPNNPKWAADRGHLNCPNGSTSAARYPYPERVWGFMRCPVKQGGSELWTGAPVTYPDPSEFCNTEGCTLANEPAYTNPLPNHRDPCQKAEVGAPYDSTTDSDGDGHLDAFDCAPTDPAIHPGAAEICNGKDDDCDGSVDESVSCPDGGVCSAGRCVECIGDADCAGGQVCWLNACVQPEPGCQTDADCGGGRCHSSRCVECVGDTDCDAGKLCQSSLCVAPPPGCQGDSECGEGRTCVEGVCKNKPSGCNSSLDCLEDEICHEGACEGAPVIGPDDDGEGIKVVHGCGCSHSEGMAVGWPLVLLGIALIFRPGRRQERPAQG